MKRLLSILIISLILLNISFVLSEQILQGTPSNIETPKDNTISPEDQQLINQRLLKEQNFNITAIILSIIAFITGIVITIFMVKKNSKILNIIIHGLIVIISAILSVTNTIDTINCVGSQYCSTTPIGLFFFVAIPTLIFSLFISWNLIKKKRYKESNKWGINLSSGMIISTLLVWIAIFVSELIIQPQFDIPASFVLVLLITPIGFSLYFILGIIGLFIDKIHNT